MTKNKNLKNCVAVGGELGTSTSKFCAEGEIVTFSSVVGDTLTESMEKSWHLMNRSSDTRWIRNLAVYDENRKAWRYVGSMTRNSSRVNWFTNRGIIQNYDDAFIGIQAGLFLLAVELEKKGKTPLEDIGMAFGITVKSGEATAEEFFKYIGDRLHRDGDKKYLIIKAKNIATGETKEIKININFLVIQYQAFGAHMVLLFRKYKMKVFNTYIIDIGHGTWIKLPIIDNEADLNLSEAFPEGVFTITKNISTVVFEASNQKFKIPEQRLMEKLPQGDYKIEVPGSGVYDFEELLETESAELAEKIFQNVKNDISILSQKGQFIDYFTVIGGGSHLLFDKISKKIAEYYGWDQDMEKKRIIDPKGLSIDPRYVNCAGFMLLARDQIALELQEEVDSSLDIDNITDDYVKE